MSIIHESFYMSSYTWLYNCRVSHRMTYTVAVQEGGLLGCEHGDDTPLRNTSNYLPVEKKRNIPKNFINTAVRISNQDLLFLRLFPKLVAYKC